MRYQGPAGPSDLAQYVHYQAQEPGPGPLPIEGERAINIAVVGAGYVGLTTAACLAHIGHDVVCADVIAPKVEALNQGIIPIVEDGLSEVVRSGLDTGRLRFVVGAAEAVVEAEFVFLCVPTPKAADGSADMSFIEAAARR